MGIDTTAIREALKRNHPVTVLRTDAFLMLDELDRLREVAHVAWHLLQDTGDPVTTPAGDELPLYLHAHADHERLAHALCALEGAGWVPPCQE